jgi:hypothetical protein
MNLNGIIMQIKVSRLQKRNVQLKYQIIRVNAPIVLSNEK